MAQVTVSLNGRSYLLRCGDGEEARLAELAAYVGQRVDDLAMEFGQYGDERLLLMVTLMLADEAQDLRVRLAEYETTGAAPGARDPEAAAILEPAEAAKPASAPAASDTIAAIQPLRAPPASAAAAIAPAEPAAVPMPRPAAKPSPAKSSLEARLAEARSGRSAATKS